MHRLVDFDDTTVLLTTHDLAEAEKLADRILILDGGRIVAEGSAEELAREVAGSSEVTWVQDGVRHVHATEDATGFARRLLTEHGEGISALEISSQTLEETYLSMVARRESETTAGAEASR